MVRQVSMVRNLHMLVSLFGLVQILPLAPSVAFILYPKSSSSSSTSSFSSTTKFPCPLQIHSSTDKLPGFSSVQFHEYLPCVQSSSSLIVLSMAQKGGGGGSFFRSSKRSINRNEDDENNSNDGGEDETNQNEPEKDVSSEQVEDEEDEGEEDEDTTTYVQIAASEFLDKSHRRNKNRLAPGEKSGQIQTTNLDWGGEYGKLRQRVSDIQDGKTGPANALFRTVTMNSPNEAIASFVKEANPEVVTAMSGAVSSLLGGLSNPLAGIETIVKANKEKLASLCFQLQMTGYMFRNAEYVLAIKELMKIDGSASLQDYKIAFDRLDKDKSGYIEIREIESLLSDVYDGNIPSFEIETFLTFFDSNKDGKISWHEFEKGFGEIASKKAADQVTKIMKKGSFIQSSTRAALPGGTNFDHEDENDENNDEMEHSSFMGEPNISGIVKVEFKSGKIIEVEAREYMDELKKEAESLKEALKKERGGSNNRSNGNTGLAPSLQSDQTDIGGITGYIASLQGDVQSLTKGISPDVVEAMKLVVDYVVEGGPASSNKNRPKKNETAEMEIPGSALQQLALWQLVLGYKLREAEATGEYRNIMKQ